MVIRLIVKQKIIISNPPVVTLCDTCPEDSLEIAKYAVKEITEDFEESNEWALQHIDKAKSKVSF